MRERKSGVRGRLRQRVEREKQGERKMRRERAGKRHREERERVIQRGEKGVDLKRGK